MKRDHPEARDGEVLLTNEHDKGYRVYRVPHIEIEYKTKRIGKVAYSSSGEVVKGMRPVFVSEEEYLEKIGGEDE